jgi:hypothetical protein
LQLYKRKCRVVGVAQTGDRIHMIQHVYRQLNIQVLQVFGKIDDRRRGTIEVRPRELCTGHFAVRQQAAAIGGSYPVAVDM